MSAKLILVVDDDAAIVRIIQKALVAAGYEVHAAFDGETAIELLNTEHPDLVVLDINLPKKGGISVYYSIANKYDGSPKIPVIVMTGRSDLEGIFKDLHVDAFLSKPFEMPDLIEAVNQSIAKHYHEPGTPGLAAHQERSPVSVSKTILIADDEEATADYLYKGLETDGHEIEWVKSLSDLMYFAEKKRPDVIFIKLAHSHVVGPEIMDALQLKNNPKTAHIPLYFYTHHRPGVDYSHYETVCAEAEVRQILQYADLKDLLAAIKACLC